MQATYTIICFALFGGLLVLAADTVDKSDSESALRSNVTEEMHLITKSLEDLLGELAVIKREATGRLSNVKNRASSATDQERIRQTKVSRFVLKRVAELELESQGMRDDMQRLFLLRGDKPSAYHGELKQEDFDFEEPAATSTTAKQQSPSATSVSEGMPATSTLKPEEEAAKIGFDIEALKKLGEEIGKRLDQIGKEVGKNVGDLVEGIKLVFREPTTTAKPAPTFRRL